MFTKTKFLISFALLISVQLASASDDDVKRTIRVTGEGKSSATPDMATIHAGVVTQAPLATDAMEQNNEVVERLMAELKTKGVADKDIQTSRFNVQPEYERDPRGGRKPNIVGYQVTNQLRVRVRDLPKLGKLLDALIHAGSNQVSGISFGVDDANTVMNKARTKAVADARARAELYAKAADVTVGKVLSISEHQVTSPQPVFYGRSMEARATSVPIATGEQDFIATINVTFQLVDE